MTFGARAFCVAAVIAALGLGCCEPTKRNGPPVTPAALSKLKAETPKAVPHVTFAGGNGETYKLEELRGRYVLLNLWATWCAPCVRELPALGRLQAAVGKSQFVIVPVNVGRGTAAETATFLETNKAALPVYLDTKSAFLHAFGAFGLPLTVLIDPKGREIARASGAVHWDGNESIAYFRSLKAGG